MSNMKQGKPADGQDFIIWPQDVYATAMNGQRFCAGKARMWFTRHGLSWSDFVANGIQASVVIGIGDALGLAVVDQVKHSRVKE